MDDKIIPLELPGTVHAQEPTPEPEMTAAQMLRSFEDEHLGKDVPRVEGKVEHGHGSKLRKLEAHLRAHHDLLVKFAQAEEEMSTTAAAHSQAMIKHAEAAEAVKRHAK